MRSSNLLPVHFLSVCAIALSVLLPVGAGAVTISVSLSPAGIVTVGQQFDVSLSVSGWDAADGGVDSIAFNVDYDMALFAFIGGSGVALNDGMEFLAESTQGAGYSLVDNSSEALVGSGRFIFGASDIGDALSGSIGGADGAGLLGGFKLRAIATGVGLVSVHTSDPNQIFGDPGFFGITPSQGVSLGVETMRVIPELSVQTLILIAVALIASRRRRKS